MKIEETKSREEIIDAINIVFNINRNKEEDGENYETLVIRDASNTYISLLKEEREKRNMPLEKESDKDYAEYLIYSIIEGYTDLPESMEMIIAWCKSDIDVDEEILNGTKENLSKYFAEKKNN